MILLVICWWYLTRVAFTFKQKKFAGGKAEINRQLDALGPLTYEEKSVAAVFLLTAFAWITRSFLLAEFIPGIDDTIIAIASGLVLFVLPAKDRTARLMTWEDAVRLPWGILLLFGGGMALAMGFETTGLARWIGSQMSVLENIPLFLALLILIAAVNFLTEITSNLATTAMLLPILVSIAAALGVNPNLLLVGATVAASCAFMLPVATPPNAVVFGSGYLKIEDMVKKGIWMNIISILLLTVIVYYFLPLVWGFEL